MAQSLQYVVRVKLNFYQNGDIEIMDNTNDTATKQVKENATNLKEDFINSAKDTMGKVKQEIANNAEKINETADTYKAKVSDNLSGVAEKVHTKSDTAQEFLSKKADLANEYAHQTIEKANQLSHRAAAALSNSAEYVKDFDLAETTKQVKNTMKQKPEITLTLVGIFGFLIGLLIGRRKS